MHTVGLNRGKNLDENISKAVEAAGGLPDIKGKSILIKPNVNSNDPYPATTNPQTLSALIRYIRGLEPELIGVSDSSNASYLPTVESIKELGIFQAAEAEGARISGFEDSGWEPVSIEKAKNWGMMTVPLEFKKYDYIVNLFNVKTHYLARYSMALKNWMGTVSHRNRISMHMSPRPVFWQMIAEINLARKADFFIGDAMACMVTGGPFSGDIKEAGIIIAGRNPTETDAAGLAILKMLGTTEEIENSSIWDQPVLKRAVELGLGAKNGSVIEIVSNDETLEEELMSYLLEKEEKAA